MKPLLEQAPDVRTATASLPTTAAASVQIVDPLAIPDWDALVMSLPGHSFFHSSAWARVLEQAYGYKPIYFAKVENGKLSGLLPMMEVDSWLTGKRCVSLPFSDQCELLGDWQPLWELALAEGRERGWKRVEVRDDLNRQTAECSESFFGHSIELSRDEEKIFSSFEPSVRRAIRKAEKCGVKLEISHSLDAVQEFYQLHCQTRKKHGVPPQPFSFFANFHRHVIAHNYGFLAIAKINSRAIAASVFVHFGTAAIYKYGASDENYQNFRGPNLVMWHAIQWLARAGFDRLDFGRTDHANEGLRRFKLGWGAEERPINYFKYDLRTKQFIHGKGERSQLREKVFKRIPIPMARIIGSVLYRHVA
jgi:hypothetical protein